MNLPKQTIPVAEKKKELEVISTPKVTTAPPKSPVEEGTSNDSSKGEIIFINKEEAAQETEITPNAETDQVIEQPNKVSHAQVESLGNTTAKIS